MKRVLFGLVASLLLTSCEKENDDLKQNTGPSGKYVTHGRTFILDPGDWAQVNGKYQQTVQYDGLVISEDTAITVGELKNYPQSVTSMDTLPLVFQGVSAGVVDYAIHPGGEIDIIWNLDDPNDFNPWELQIIVNLYFWLENLK